MHQIIQHYGGPARLATDRSAATKLRQWGDGLLENKKIDKVIESARTPRGIPIGPGKLAWLREIGSELHKSISEVKACRGRLTTLAESHAGMRKYKEAVSAVTLCVIWSCVCDPGNYSRNGAFLKALWLNLNELSSGKRQGQEVEVISD